MSDYSVPVENYYGVESAVSPVLSEVDFPRYQSDVDLQPVSVGIAPVDANYFAPSMVYRDTFMNADVLQQAEQSNSDFFLSRQVDSNLGNSDLLSQSNGSSSITDADLVKLISQEKFDSQVGSNYQDAVLSSPPDSPEIGDNKGSYPKDPLPDSNNVETASIQPITVEDDKKAKKSFNWLPIVLVVAAVGGYMYYNRKK
jgi:hypothetical protein